MKLDESGSVTRADNSGSGNDFTVTGTINSTSDSGHLGIYCFGVENTPNTLNSASGNGMNFGNNGDFAIAFWFKKYTDPGTQMTVFKTAGTGVIEILFPNASNDSLQFKVGGMQTWAAASLMTNSWYHVVLNQDRDGGFYIYINGALFNHDGTTTTGENISTTSLNICSSLNDTDKLQGDLDNVGVWNRLLNQTEISDLYNMSTVLD